MNIAFAPKQESYFNSARSLQVWARGGDQVGRGVTMGAAMEIACDEPEPLLPRSVRRCRKIILNDMPTGLDLTYRSPMELYEEANCEMVGVPLDRLFNNPRYQKPGEKWCAAMFGRGYEQAIRPLLVAINDTNYHTDADFFVKLGAREEPFQIVEAMEPDRRRGAEYKETSHGTARTFPYEPERGRIEGPQWIGDRIGQKAAKNYAGAITLNLLVYANFSGGLIDHAALVAASKAYQASFASIWVISNLHIGTLCGSNTLGHIEGWWQIQTIDEYNAQVDTRQGS